MLIPGLGSGNPAVRARAAANAGFISPNPTPSFNGTGLGGSGQGATTTTTSPYYYGGGFPDPFSGNIFAGIPTQISQTPYGSMLAQAKQYLYTPQQLSNIANQQAQAQTKAALDASYANQTAEQATFAAMQNRAAGLAQALGNFGPGYASAIQDIYDKAAQTQAAVGPGVVQQGVGDMSTALAAAQQQAADKTGGQGQVTSYDPNALGATLQTTGVEMPGNALATSGANAAQMALYGAMADKAQIGAIGQYYQQQAVDALNQRTAERAQIIAQQPALYQQALEAQRQDNYQTQARIDDIIGQGQSWIAQRMGLRLQSAQAQSDWAFKVAGFTHQNPYTGQAQSGYIPVKLADGSTTIVPFADAAKAAHWGAQGAHWSSQDIIALDRVRVSAMRTGAPKTGSFGSGGLYQVDPSGNVTIVRQPTTAPPKTASFGSGGLYQVDAKGNVKIVREPTKSTTGDQFRVTKGGKTWVYTKGSNGKWTGQALPGGPTGAGGGSPLSANEVQGDTAKINRNLGIIKQGGKWKDPDGVIRDHPPVTSRAEAQTRLEQWGYFSSPQLAKIATKWLNYAYPPGKKILNSGPFNLPIGTG